MPDKLLVTRYFKNSTARLNSDIQLLCSYIYFKHKRKILQLIFMIYIGIGVVGKILVTINCSTFIQKLFLSSFNTEEITEIYHRRLNVPLLKVSKEERKILILEKSLIYLHVVKIPGFIAKQTFQKKLFPYLVHTMTMHCSNKTDATGLWPYIRLDFWILKLIPSEYS